MIIGSKKRFGCVIGFIWLSPRTRLTNPRTNMVDESFKREIVTVRRSCQLNFEIGRFTTPCHLSLSQFSNYNPNEFPAENADT
uniref:Uncharacterized protein n=1 Tax=Noccaea caerulescens TaxID=107243 RepID=A0A1J3IVM7_NOCCA